MLHFKFNSNEELRKYVLSDVITCLPLSAQALYLQVVINGTVDDKGKVSNIITLANAIGASEGDIDILMDVDYYYEVDE